MRDPFHHHEPTGHERFRALVCGLPERIRQRKYILMFKLFLDESGNDPGQPYFILAGYLTAVPLWDKFTEQWDALCRSWGIDHFHMTEAEALDGPYSSWSDTKNCRVATLAGVIQRHIIHGFANDVKLSTYSGLVEKAAKDQPKTFARLIESPYLSMSLLLLFGVANQCERRKIRTKDVLVVFADKDGKLRDREKNSLRRSCSWAGFPDPQFSPASELPPLQAADMLAWRINQNCLKRPGLWPVPARHRPLLERLYIRRITAADLASIRINIRAEIVDPSKLPKRKGKLPRIRPINFQWDSDGDDG